MYTNNRGDASFSRYEAEYQSLAEVLRVARLAAPAANFLEYKIEELSCF